MGVVAAVAVNVVIVATVGDAVIAFIVVVAANIRMWRNFSRIANVS